MNEPAAPSLLLRSFERHLRALNRSGNTIQSYSDVCRLPGQRPLGSTN